MSHPPEQPEGTDGIPAPGDVLAGKYRVERVIGVGGMGVVVAAMHLHLHERVALKFLLPQMINPETVARFAREARAAAKIKSEHVAHVTDVGTLESGSPYMVMEFLEGSDLSELIHEKGALPIRDAVEYVLQACDAVAEAHSLGIVHRDLKPANLFLARHPGGPSRVKVLDFGISKVQEVAGAADHSMTKTRAWLGSPLYMSPEQMKSARDVDGRTDVWSLGLILFELLTGAVPFDGANLPELCAQIIHGEPPDLERKRPEVPAGLGDVIRRCLEKDPARRYQNVAELVMALVEYAPRRARSVAERAVSLTEAAGIMRPPAVKRQALDATLPPDEFESPFRDSQAGASMRQAPLVIAMSQPAPAAIPPASVRKPVTLAAAATVAASPRPLAVSGTGSAEKKASVVLPWVVGFVVISAMVVLFAYVRTRPAAPGPASLPTTAADVHAPAPSQPPVASSVPVETAAPSATASSEPSTEAAAAHAVSSAPPTAAPPSAAPAPVRAKGALRPAHSAARPPSAAPSAPPKHADEASPVPEAVVPKPNSPEPGLGSEQCFVVRDGLRVPAPCPPGP